MTQREKAMLLDLLEGDLSVGAVLLDSLHDGRDHRCTALTLALGKLLRDVRETWESHAHTDDPMQTKWGPASDSVAAWNEFTETLTDLFWQELRLAGEVVETQRLLDVSREMHREEGEPPRAEWASATSIDHAMALLINRGDTGG